MKIYATGRIHSIKNENIFDKIICSINRKMIHSHDNNSMFHKTNSVFGYLFTGAFSPIKLIRIWSEFRSNCLFQIFLNVIHRPPIVLSLVAGDLGKTLTIKPIRTRINFQKKVGQGCKASMYVFVEHMFPLQDKNFVCRIKNFNYRI